MKKAVKIIFVSMLLVMALAMGIPAQAAAKKAKLLKRERLTPWISTAAGRRTCVSV